MAASEVEGRRRRLSDRARRTLRRYPALRWGLLRARGKLPRSRPSEPLAQLIFEFARAYPKAAFVQVGANDGGSGDPLRDEVRFRRWRGVMVEPVPYVFESLRENYAGHPRVALENAAIGERDGVRELFYLARAEPGSPDLPDWYDELGTFHREVIEKHRRAIPDFDERVRSLDVPCVTFESLCRKHGLDRIDLIQTDTEGHDFEILKLVDLERLKPRLLMYEHLHFDEATSAACSEHLEAHGYGLLADVVNTVALRTVDLEPRDAALVRLWRQLRAQRGGQPSDDD